MRFPAAPSLSAPALRWFVVAAILVLPALTLWNLAAASLAPKLQVKMGPSLRGVTESAPPVEWSLQSFADGSLQRAAAEAITDAIPIRPLLIRLNNKVRREVFGQLGAPGIVSGKDGNLIEEHYLTEFCTRDTEKLRARAEKWIPRLKELQSFYQDRGRKFLYITTPSKVAHMPEVFVDSVACPSSAEARQEHLPVYARMLADAGINFVDTASLVHGLRGKFEVELYPQGGVHWNALGAAHAADAFLAKINELAGNQAAPRLSWTYEVTDRPTGEDTDLIDVANILFGRPRYPTAKVTFQRGKACPEWPASKMKIAVVGGSFTQSLGQILASAGCLGGLSTYFHLYQSVRGGPAQTKMGADLKPADIRALLRDVDLVVLEENEIGIAGMRHAAEFYRVIMEEQPD